MTCSVCGGPIAHWNQTGICTGSLACKAARGRLHRQRFPEANTEAHRRWRMKNPEQERESTRKWVLANPDYVRPYIVRYRQVKAEMARSQDFLCAICGKFMPEGNRYLDHDHACCPGRPEKACGNCYRGVTHNLCNRWLGLAGDDPEVLEHAAAYLRSKTIELTVVKEASDAG